MLKKIHRLLYLFQNPIINQGCLTNLLFIFFDPFILPRVNMTAKRGIWPLPCASATRQTCQIPYCDNSPYLRLLVTASRQPLVTLLKPYNPTANSIGLHMSAKILKTIC